jgi:hypothetical protein
MDTYHNTTVPLKHTEMKVTIKIDPSVKIGSDDDTEVNVMAGARVFLLYGN